MISRSNALRCLHTLWLLVCLLPVAAQSPAFAPAPENDALLKGLADQYEQRYKTTVSTLPATHKKELEEIYKQRWEHIRTSFDKKDIYTAPMASQYMDAMVSEIVKANPLLQNQTFNCYFSRSGVPNASYIGEGIILFNMGLFRRLENESQVAFVLCHEIAHFLLRHSENSIAQYVTTMNSGKVQEELKAIKKKEFNKREQLDKLVKGIRFDHRRHSRDHESEADSMAVELMRPTRFNMNGALSALALLDKADEDSIPMAALLEQRFHSTGYPFRKKWLARNEGLLGGHARLKEDEKMADSLKTHLDCEIRIRQLTPMVARYQTATRQQDVISKPKMDSLRHLFRYEIIEHAFNTNDYSLSLYYTIDALQQLPEDPYLITHTGKILNSCYTASRQHTLGKVIGLPAPERAGSYNTLLQFLQNLYREDFAGISHHYLQQFHTTLQHYPPFRKIYDTSLQLIKE